MPNYLDELAKLRQNYGQRVADYPATAENIREQIYGGDKVLPTLRATRDDAIMALYDVDKRLADRYSNPQSETFIRDPYAREKLAAGQHQSVLGSVSGAERQVAAREDILGNNLTKALDLLKMSLEGTANQYNMLLNEAKLTESSGGTSNDLASLVALLAGKGKGAGETREATPDELIKARRLAEGRKGPVSAPAPNLNLWDKWTNLISGITGGAVPKASGTVSSYRAPEPAEGDIAKALQDITGIVPKTPETSPMSQLGLGTDQLALLQAVSGSSPKLGEKLAEKYITEFLFPDEGGSQTEFSTKTEAKRELLDKIAEYSEDLSMPNSSEEIPTVEEFRQQMLLLYPELDPKEIEEIIFSFDFSNAQ